MMIDTIKKFVKYGVFKSTTDNYDYAMMNKYYLTDNTVTYKGMKLNCFIGSRFFFNNCDCCGKAHFLNNGYTHLGYAILCPECMRNIDESSIHFDKYIDILINNPNNADKYLSDTILKSLGFKKVSHVYRIGLHEDDNDTTEKIIKKYQKFDVIFKILEQNPFDTIYCAYIR